MSDNAQEAFDEDADNLVTALSIDAKGWLQIVPNSKSKGESFPDSKLQSNGGSNDRNGGDNVIDLSIIKEEVIGNFDSEGLYNINNLKEHEVFSGCRALLQRLEAPTQKDGDSKSEGSNIKGSSDANVNKDDVNKDDVDKDDVDKDDVDKDDVNKDDVNKDDNSRDQNDDKTEHTNIEDSHITDGNNDKDGTADRHEEKVIDKNETIELSPPEPSNGGANGTPIKDLFYINNIYEDINRAVNELVKMRDVKEKPKYGSNESTENDGKDRDSPRSKYRGRRKLKGKYEKAIHNVDEINSGMNKASIASEENDADGRNDEAEWTQVTPKPDQFSNEVYSPVNGSYLTQITFNTFSILIPIIDKMLNHPERANYELEMNGPKIRKRDYSQNNRKRVKIPENIMDIQKDVEKRPKKSQCYLFFDKVYSITTIKALDNLRREVDRLLRCFPSDVDPIQPHLLWGTCRTSKEIIQKTFVFDKSSCSVLKTVIGQKDLEVVEKFSKSVDTELIQPLTEHNKEIVEKQMDLVNHLHNELKHVLERENRFRGLKLTVYGSCLSELSLGRASDVDISLHVPIISQLKNDFSNKRITIRNYEKKMKDFVFEVKNKIRKGGRSNFFDVSAVPYARVPVVKGTFKGDSRIGGNESINFDICFLNDIAVANSNLLREYSLIDPRIKMMMLSVKSWIKWKDVGNAAENTLSSYSWMILVIFYLQCIDFVPVLQNPQFMAEHQEYHNEQNRLHFVNNLRTHFLTCSQVKKAGLWKLPDHFSDTSVSVLLAGFFIFYARHFPKHTTAVSIRLGRCVLQKSVFRSAKLWRICIEDPFETHCSHCPHDLGTPMNEDGQARVDKALQDAADQMGHMFADCSEVHDSIGTFHHLTKGIDLQPAKHDNHVQNHRNQRNNRPRNIYGRQNRHQRRGGHNHGGFDKNHSFGKEHKNPEFKTPAHKQPQRYGHKPKRNDTNAGQNQENKTGNEDIPVRKVEIPQHGEAIEEGDVSSSSRKKKDNSYWRRRRNHKKEGYKKN